MVWQGHRRADASSIRRFARDILVPGFWSIVLLLQLQFVYQPFFSEFSPSLLRSPGNVTSLVKNAFR